MTLRPPGVGVERRYETDEVEDATLSEAVPVPVLADVVSVASLPVVGVAVPTDCVDAAEVAEDASVAFVKLKPSG